MVFYKMFSLSILKIKLLTVLSMVFMGLFSRIVLGFPVLIPTSTPAFRALLERYQFPDGGSRTSLRFLPTLRCIQKRRRILKNGRSIEEEVTLFQAEPDNSQFDFIGEVVEQENPHWNLKFKT